MSGREVLLEQGHDPRGNCFGRLDRLRIFARIGAGAHLGAGGAGVDDRDAGLGNALDFLSVAFEQHVKGWAMVRECWTLSGDIDFIMKCVAPNLASFQGLVSELTSLPNVRNVRTALTLDLIKDDPLVPIEDVAAVEG